MTAERSNAVGLPAVGGVGGGRRPGVPAHVRRVRCVLPAGGLGHGPLQLPLELHAGGAAAPDAGAHSDRQFSFAAERDP